MSKQYNILAAVIAAALALSGCNGALAGGGSQLGPIPSATPPSSPAGEAEAPSPSPGEESLPSAEGDEPTPELQPDYISSLARQTAEQIAQPGMGEYEKAKAAFDYMIETAVLLDPMGLDLWRVRGDSPQPPPYVENRSLSILLFRIGKCEDYAAALTLLLREMGLEAEYVPGLTYSSQGELVDHAWTVAKINGIWYHLDCQLEQNISRHGSIRYKYFMRGDATMAGSHRWGQNLIDTRLLTAAQNEEIARDHIPPACPQDYPTPSRHSFTPATPPDLTAIEWEIAAEFREYERLHGPLEPLELNIVPPVFALEGYGPQD